VRDFAALRHALRRAGAAGAHEPPARPPPRRGRSSMEGRSKASAARAPTRRQHSIAIRRQGAWRMLDDGARASEATTSSSAAGSQESESFCRFRPARNRTTKREPPSPAPVATGLACGGRKQHGKCVREGRRQFVGTNSARAQQSLARARAAQITRRTPLSGHVPRRARARRPSSRRRQRALRGG